MYLDRVSGLSMNTGAFRNNEAQEGGGVASYESREVKLTGASSTLVFANNKASGIGGGVFILT